MSMMSTLAVTKVMLAFIASLAVVLLGMPSLIRLAVQKNLLDEPSEDRKVHTRSVPRLGGVLIFIGTLVTTSILVDPVGDEAIAFLRLGAAATNLFFLGLKDDLSVLDPYKSWPYRCLWVLCSFWAAGSWWRIFRASSA